MPCYHPLKAARPTGSDEKPIFFKRGETLNLDKCWEELALPCGQCIGCRLERSRQWAVRMMHEAQLWENNAFITLTYDDEHLPADGALNRKHFQDFMKRLRQHAWREGERARSLSYKERKRMTRTVLQEEGDTGIRFFHCGEYGESFTRPHYHAILFNIAFADSLFFREDRGSKVYTSATLDKLWGMGFALIGEVTFESAAYVARYVTKKVTGKKAEEHYTRDDPLTGAVRQLPPEYATMSNRPGIAANWFETYEKDVFPRDEVISRGRRAKPPRYYDKKFEAKDPEKYYQVIKQRREADARKRAHDNTPARLEAKEKVKHAQLKQLKRSFEK